MLKNLFISDSFAQEAAATVATAPDFSLGSLVPFVLVIAIFYALIIRPQNKKMKEHQNMVRSLKVGSRVITSAGFVGVVRKVVENSEEIEVEIADGVVVKIMRQYISDLTAEEKEKLAKKAEKKK